MNRIGEVGDDPDLPRADLGPVPSLDELRAENKELHLRLARLQGQVNVSVPLAVLKRWAEECQQEPDDPAKRFEPGRDAYVAGRRGAFRELIARCDGEGWPHWVEPDSPSAPDPGDDAG